MYNMMSSFLQEQPQHVRAAVLTHSSRPKCMTVLAPLWDSLHYPGMARLPAVLPDITVSSPQGS